jgi:N-glycosylase/DNA lyase
MILDSIIVEQAVHNLICRIEMPNNVHWTNHSESDLLKELTLCILSSSIRYEVALLYAIKMEKQKYFARAIHNGLCEFQICDCLMEPVLLQGRFIRYRFPKTKGKQLFNTINNIYGNKLTIKEILLNAETSIKAREILISMCTGVGHKQSSMFLRNIGFGYDLAIIDTHILDYLRLIDVLPADINVKSRFEYSAIEELYHRYAQSRQLDVQKLDVAIWNIMKAYKTKFLL